MKGAIGMKLKDIKNYLLNLKGINIRSARGNIYNVKKISWILFDYLKGFSTVRTCDTITVRDKEYHVVKWYENHNYYEVIVELI